MGPTKERRKTGSQSKARSDRKRKRHYCPILSGLQMKRGGSSRFSPRDVTLDHLPGHSSSKKEILQPDRWRFICLFSLYSPGSETNWPSGCICVPKNIYSVTTPSYFQSPSQNYYPFQGLQD